MDSFIRKSDFENLLLKSWTTFVDGPQVLKRALVDARDSDYKTIVPADPSVSIKTGVTISKFELTNKGLIEIWVEFTVPRQEGAVVGTHVYSADLSGKMELKSTFGTIFRLESEAGS